MKKGNINGVAFIYRRLFRCRHSRDRKGGDKHTSNVASFNAACEKQPRPWMLCKSTFDSSYRRLDAILSSASSVTSLLSTMIRPKASFLVFIILYPDRQANTQRERENNIE